MRAGVASELSRRGECPMSGEAGLAAVTAFLERRGVAYEVVEHERTQSAAEEARAAGMPPATAAKTVVLSDQDGHVWPTSARSESKLSRRIPAPRCAG